MPKVLPKTEREPNGHDVNQQVIIYTAKLFTNVNVALIHEFKMPGIIY